MSRRAEGTADESWTGRMEATEWRRHSADPDRGGPAGSETKRTGGCESTLREHTVRAHCESMLPALYWPMCSKTAVQLRNRIQLSHSSRMVTCAG